MLAIPELKPIGPWIKGEIVGYVDPKMDQRDSEAVNASRAWYALLVAPQHESIAAAHLTGRRFKTYFPTVPACTTRGLRRAKVTVHQPMMRGYVFIRLDFRADGDRLHHIMATPGVHRFLRMGDRLAVISDQDMRRVENIARELAKPKPVQSIWSVGEVVRVSDGVFSGINAVITDIVSQDRIKVEIPLLGQAVPITLDSAILEKL